MSTTIISLTTILSTNHTKNLKFDNCNDDENNIENNG